MDANTTTTPRRQRLAAPRLTVTIERPRCPRCGSARLFTQRSVRDQGDGSTLRQTKCVTCSLNFDIVLE